MNDILQLKGTFQQRPSEGRPGYPSIPKGSASVRKEHLQEIARKLKELQEYWSKVRVVDGALIDIHYSKVVAKSNRVSGFFSEGSLSANDTIRGARFKGDKKDPKHVITHYVHDDLIFDTISKLEKTIKLLGDRFGDSISSEQLEKLSDLNIDFNKYKISRSTFCNFIVDSFYVEDFDMPKNSDNVQGSSIITIYETDANVAIMMKRIGIDVPTERKVNDTTILLRPPEILLLKDKAPYLIAMAIEDISKLNYDDFFDGEIQQTGLSIPAPSEEPTIGVIDTMFDDRVYFSDWVEFRKMIPDEIPIDGDDSDHGTSISSIIVDGATLNPSLDDGCGRFKVRHFGVAAKSRYSSFDIMTYIQEIVSDNPDIKVWNLSLGSDSEINLNSISPEASILDKIQYENDVIFVVAGTNKHDITSAKRIGAPADSINSIVVNSVNSDGSHASYSREGLVLSFFNKPDVSSYGGDKVTNDYIRVFGSSGESLRTGTSFAAPWVARKVAYLIHVLGLPREVAKALIVDAAAGWKDAASDQRLAPLIGHGAVPIRIEDVTTSSNEEIKFVMSGTSEMYDTYTYGLPVPMHEEKYPFVAKATLCYFPKCSINQGVDYTNTELDLYIGRVDKKGIKSINKNLQSREDGEKYPLYEGEARKWYRKWDNTKHVRESFGEKLMPRKAYDSGMWGVSIKTKERLRTNSKAAKDGDGIKFGLVVTLKEINGVNRVNDFIRQCELRGWLVNKIDIEARAEIYNKAQETITFDT